jgi:hypothetical protein
MPDIIVDPEVLAAQMGDKSEEFIKCLGIVQDIIENPQDYIGMQAIKYANIWV